MSALTTAPCQCAGHRVIYFSACEHFRFREKRFFNRTRGGCSLVTAGEKVSGTFFTREDANSLAGGASGAALQTRNDRLRPLQRSLRGRKGVRGEGVREKRCQGRRCQGEKVSGTCSPEGAPKAWQGAHPGLRSRPAMIVAGPLQRSLGSSGKTSVGTFWGDRIADLAALTFRAARDGESGRPGRPGLRPLATKFPADHDTRAGRVAHTAPRRVLEKIPKIG
jgi:hypothetical protein